MWFPVPNLLPIFIISILLRSYLNQKRSELFLRKHLLSTLFGTHFYITLFCFRGGSSKSSAQNGFTIRCREDRDTCIFLIFTTVFFFGCILLRASCMTSGYISLNTGIIFPVNQFALKNGPFRTTIVVKRYNSRNLFSLWLR